MKWYNIFCYHISDNAGWIRIFGIGISWKHVKHGLLFSQRNGYRKYIELLNYYLWFLKYAKL